MASRTVEIANVFVPGSNALYPQMVARAQRDEQGEHRLVYDPVGIWVPEAWIPGARFRQE